MSNAYVTRKYYPDGSSEPVREEIVLHDYRRPNTSPSQGNGTSINNTDDLPEGSKNLYYHEDKVKSLVLSLLSSSPSNKEAGGDLKALLEGRASAEDLQSLQIAVAKMQQAVTSLLSKTNSSSSDFNDALLELKKELAAKVSSSEFIKLVSARVTIQDLEAALKPYATTSGVNLLSDKVNKQELRLRALESTEDTHSTASLLELINKKVSKDELKESLATYSALLGNIQNGLSGYATTSYVRSEIERTRLDPARFATPADVEALSKTFDAKLKDSAKAITSALSVGTGSLVTHESFNLRMTQEVTKLNEKIGDLATKKQIEAITPLLVSATPTQQGLMSSFDKEKLDALPVPRSIAMKDDLIAVSKRVSALESSGLDTSKLVTQSDLDLLAEELRVANKKADLSPYALSSDVNGKYAKLAERVSVLETKADKPIDLSSLVTVQTFNALANKVNAISIPTLPDFKSFAQVVKVEELDKSLTTFKKEVETNYLGKQAFRTEIETVQDLAAQQIKGLSSRIDRLNAAIRMLPSGDVKVDGAAVTDEQLEGKLSSIRKELQSLAKELETKSNALQQVNQAVYRRLDAATAATVALEQRVSETALVNAEQNGKIDLLKASIAKLPDTNLVSEIARRVSAVETKVGAIKIPSIESLETQVGVHSAELLTVRNQVREIQTVLPTEAKPTNDTLVSHGAMKKYVSATLADSLSPSATRTSEGLVRLATQAEVHSRTGTSVPTVADVSTMLTNLPVASNRANGLMTPAMLYSLEQAATKRELSDESSKLNDSFTTRLTQQNKRIDSIGMEQSNLRVRVATLEGVSGIDTTVFATKTEHNSLKEEVERVSKFDRLTHDDLEDAKTLITKGYEAKVKELDSKLSAEIAKVSDKVAKQPDKASATETQPADTSNLVTRRELNLTAAEIRSEIPKFKAGNLVTSELFSETLLTKVNPLVEKVALIQKELSSKVGTIEFNDYKESANAASGGRSAAFAKRNDLDAVKKTVDGMVSLLGGGRGLDNLVTVDALDAKLATCNKTVNTYTDTKVTEASNRISALETRMAAVDGDGSDSLSSKTAKTEEVNAVKSDLAAYKESNTKEINALKELVSPASGKVAKIETELEAFKANASGSYIPMSDKASFATKEELKDFSKKSELSLVSDRVSIVSESLASFREVVAAGYIPNSQRQLLATREELKGYATKEDLKAVSNVSTEGLATKEELKGYIPTSDKPSLATKEELKGYATKEELKAIPAPVSTEGLATKEELKGYASKESVSALATKEEVKLLATKEEVKGLATKAEVATLPKPSVTKVQLTAGTASTLNLSAHNGKIVRLTAVLENTTEASVTLTKATLTLGDREVSVENKELASHKHLVLGSEILVPYADSSYSALVTGADVSCTVIVEPLA